MDLNEKVTIRLDDLSLLMRECVVVVDTSAVDNYSKRMNNSSLKTSTALPNSKLTKPLNEVTKNDINIRKIDDIILKNKKRGRPKSFKSKDDEAKNEIVDSSTHLKSRENITRGLKFSLKK